MDQVNQAQDGCDFKFNVDENWRKNKNSGKKSTK